MPYYGVLQEKAREHLKYVEASFPDLIDAAIRGTKVYGGPDYTPPTLNLDIFDYARLVETDSVSAAAERVSAGEKICILNFASYKHPGGGFLQGASTQEEALCHESILYPVLQAFKDTYYEWNNRHKNGALYTNRALYTPDVLFIHKGGLFQADVVTCAAPNANTAVRYGHATREQNNEVFADRIKFLNNVIANNCPDVVIVGAWGCGVFGQDARFTAETMLRYLRPAGRMVYAVPKGYNHRIFSEVFAGDMAVSHGIL